MITDLLKVFNIQNKDDGGAGKVAGTIGLWFLHFCKFTLLIYTATHAINASWQYAGSSAPQRAFQIVGIMTVEIALLGIYLAYINGKLSGWAQLIVAFIVYLMGFTIAGLGVIVDSQLNAGILGGFAEQYLHTGLPVAPLLMGFGAVVIGVLDPNKLQVAEMARKIGHLNRQQFDADIAMKTLDMQNNLATLALQVQGKQALIMEMANLTHSPEYKQAVKQRALTEATASYHQMGIELELPSPTLSIQPTTPSPTNTPPPHDELPREEVVKDTEGRFQPSLNGHGEQPAHHNGSGPAE
ncbi:MAG: hypothetical protein WAZ19_02030 [Anaerolineae bacterium]